MSANIGKANNAGTKDDREKGVNHVDLKNAENASLFANCGFDIAENEPRQVCCMARATRAHASLGCNALFHEALFVVRGNCVPLLHPQEMPARRGEEQSEHCDDRVPLDRTSHQPLLLLVVGVEP